MLKIKIKEPELIIDTDFVLDVSKNAFAKEPDKIYEVPDSQFWMNFIVRGRLIFVEKTEDKAPEKPPEKTKGRSAKEAKNET